MLFHVQVNKNIMNVFISITVSSTERFSELKEHEKSFNPKVRKCLLRSSPQSLLRTYTYISECPSRKEMADSNWVTRKW